MGNRLSRASEAIALVLHQRKRDRLTQTQSDRFPLSIAISLDPVNQSKQAIRKAIAL